MLEGHRPIFYFVTQTYLMFRYWKKGKMYLEYNLALTLYERNIIFPALKVPALHQKNKNKKS